MSVIKSKNGVTFVYVAGPEGAKQVYLAGDFNDWAPDKRRMRKMGDGTFRARLRLPPGEYEYKFVVDGEWLNDPEAEAQRPNGFGDVNSVVSV